MQKKERGYSGLVLISLRFFMYFSFHPLVPSFSRFLDMAVHIHPLRSILIQNTRWCTIVPEGFHYGWLKPFPDMAKSRAIRATGPTARIPGSGQTLPSRSAVARAMRTTGGVGGVEVTWHLQLITNIPNRPWMTRSSSQTLFHRI